MPSKNDIINASKKTGKSLLALQKKNLKMVKESTNILTQKLIDASTMLDTKDGVLVSDKVAFAQAQKLHAKIEELYGTEFTAKMKKEIKDLSKVKGIVKDNLSSLGESVRFTSLDNDMMTTLAESYYADFVSLSAANKDKVVQAMYNQVIANAPYSDLVNTITGAVKGLKSATGRPLSQYAALYARDMTMNFHNQVMLTKAGNDYDKFLYMGTIMARSRDFCIQRVGKAYTKKQIKSWTYKWAGKSGPAMTHRGGYNCRHHWQPIKTEWLDEDELKEIEEQEREDIPEPTPPEPTPYFRRPTSEQVKGSMKEVRASAPYKELESNFYKAQKANQAAVRTYDELYDAAYDYRMKNELPPIEMGSPKDPGMVTRIKEYTKAGRIAAETSMNKRLAKKALTQFEADEFNKLIRPRDTVNPKLFMDNSLLSKSENMRNKQRAAFKEMVEETGKMFHPKVVAAVPTLDMLYNKGSRAFYRHFRNQINIGSLTSTETLVHEFSHAVEKYYPNAQKEAFAFRKRRIGNEKISTIYKGTTERGWKDEFFSHYCGKDYGDQFTEIISMGVEKMYKDPENFLNKDPDYFDFILKIMWGDV